MYFSFDYSFMMERHRYFQGKSETYWSLVVGKNYGDYDISCSFMNDNPMFSCNYTDRVIETKSYEAELCKEGI